MLYNGFGMEGLQNIYNLLYLRRDEERRQSQIERCGTDRYALDGIASKGMLSKASRINKNHLERW